MTHYGVVAYNRDCEFWKIKRLEDSLSRHDRVDEFDLVFEMGVRVAIAQLFGCERFERRFVLCEYRLAQRFDCLFDRLLIVGSGHCRHDQGCCTEREHARGGQITTCQVHGYPPIVSALLIRAARPSHPSACRSWRPATTSITRSGTEAVYNSASIASAGASAASRTLAQAENGSVAPSIAAADVVARNGWRLWVDFRGSIAVPRTAGIGAQPPVLQAARSGKCCPT